MNPQLAGLVEALTSLLELAKALGIRLALVFVMILVWDPEPPGNHPRSTMLTFRVLACFVGAAIPHWWKARAMRRRAIRLVIFLVATAGTFLFYRYAIAPSKPANSSFFVDTAFAMYILTSFCYGFTGAEAISVFWDAATAKAKQSEQTTQ